MPTAQPEAGPVARHPLHLAWMNFLHALFAAYDTKPQQVPPRIQEDILMRSGYLKHFPHQVISLGGEARGLGESLTPAACLHVYPRLQGRETRYLAACVDAHCSRFENGEWRPPYQLQNFHMLELVIVGNARAVQAGRSEVTSRIGSSFAELGLMGALRPATDAFFLGSDRGARVMQQLKGLKQEYKVQDGAESVALASFNYHEDYFGRSFEIRAGGELAHSFCAAFGLDRLTAYGLELWGSRPAHWPDPLAAHAHLP